ncbi:unnamed protein product [Rotaria magnacalcarata]|uniref:Uncharacterized protein n=1 Tax=Rotaria magnacalcarata TaxID=392030 RepID=A0A814R5F6_9BILA|nr:unnamed protein product [Rotaria magnacalcarata]CAF1665316.1 unnamed protein product [Rotaria magnacalcarata]CAF1930196.1 unnamed protein product [Rotaria magnacalcarata]CAF4036472.1 unnamed protein product [Rotaria magnacalcarata]CAF4046452.1 unnamed protein product [Rotaria magnacalcarata]
MYYFITKYVTFEKNSFYSKFISSFQITRTKPFICPIQGDKWIVITTIFYPTIAVHKFLELKSQWNLIVIGDRKTPSDWLSHITGNKSRLLFLPLNEQYTLKYSIIQYLPEGSYARKNIGYLLAIQCGGKLIFESDDDNLLKNNDIYYLPKEVKPHQVPWISFHGQRSPFVNIYASFGHPNIWPRGFPIDELKNVSEDGWHSVRRNTQNKSFIYIQQYLADLDPDVDALYRLTYPLTLGKIKFDKDQVPIILEQFTYSPYNTQNTITYYEAFWGLYLPVTTTFRVCDIWRSFWVQRLLWDIGGQLMFGTSTIEQIRNIHSYIKDMDEEYQLYHQSGSFARFLSSWSSSLPTLVQRIMQLANDIAKAGFWNSQEIQIMDAWINDLDFVGYRFPSVVSSSSSLSSSTIKQKRAAICVTGVTECIQEAWAKNYLHIRNSLQGDIDTFLFLSSSITSGPIPLTTRLKQIRSYRNTTLTILYEDRNINPNIPTNCIPEFVLPKDVYKVDAYFQQVWALAQCYHLVKDYEKRFKIKYQLMIRSRLDILAAKQFILERNGAFNVNTTLLAPPNRFFNALDDGFAVGPMELMHHYMTRWYSFKTCPPDRLYHSEYYLTRHLKSFTNVTRDSTLPAAADALPHGSQSCH